MANSCNGFIEPLNWECLFVNMFAGSMDIFIFLALVMIVGAAAFFRMTTATMLMMFVVFGIVMAQFATGIYFLVILVTGLIVMESVKRLQQ